MDEKNKKFDNAASREVVGMMKDIFDDDKCTRDRYYVWVRLKGFVDAHVEWFDTLKNKKVK